MATTNDVKVQRGIYRRLKLRNALGRVFLDRRGCAVGRFGIYIHRIDLPDPGLDLHDHPWPFVSLILRGGYTEQYAEARHAQFYAALAAQHSKCLPGIERSWGRWSVHRMPLHLAHRITETKPGTLTLCLRGHDQRTWGFYRAEGWVSYLHYDYEARRPVTEHRRFKAVP